MLHSVFTAQDVGFTVEILGGSRFKGVAQQCPYLLPFQFGDPGKQKLRLHRQKKATLYPHSLWASEFNKYTYQKPNKRKLARNPTGSPIGSIRNLFRHPPNSHD